MDSLTVRPTASSGLVTDRLFLTLIFAGLRMPRGRFLAVGNNEAILQSGFFGPPILRVRSFTGNAFEFSVDAELGRNYRLQGSLNLRDWSDLDLFSNTEDETRLFMDSDADQLPRRFFRVISP